MINEPQVIFSTPSSSGVASIQTVATFSGQPDLECLTLYKDGVEVGRLSWGTGVVQFTGLADESVSAFFQAIDIAAAARKMNTIPGAN